MVLEYLELKFKKQNLMFIKEILLIINLMDMVNTAGTMEENIKEIGKIMLWVEKENLPGRMVLNFKDCIKTIKNMEMVLWFGGKIKLSGKVDGITGYKMETENFSIKANLILENGKMELELNGLILIKK